MNNQDPIYTRAKTAVESILNALDVARVVYVDDWNTTTPTLEDTIAAALTIDTTAIQILFPELGELPLDDLDILRQKIRDIWPTLDSDLQSERSKTITATALKLDGNEIDDIANITVLKQIIPRDKLFSLSPSDWDEQQTKWLAESQAYCTLFIFDRDLSRDGGDSESGIKIIASLLAKKDNENIICGLLTHTITPETMFEQWKNLSEEHSISKDRFIVIPKLYLSQSPVLFAQTLKFTALSLDFTNLKHKTNEIIRTAAKVAADRIEKVDIYDLDHIVFQVSANEGLWEPDMLFRLHTMFHRLESRRLAYDTGALETIAAKMRALSRIPTKHDLLPIPSSAWALQREELYESNDHINKNHLPLELGDIFEKHGGESNKKFILLAQPCDLMVRSNGRRQPELQRVPLAEIVIADKNEPPCYSEEMPYFDLSPTNNWFVKFKYIHFVRDSLLDLCVFNHDGVAKLTVGQNAPSGIRPAWKARHEMLLRGWNKIICKYNMFAPAPDDSPVLKQFKQTGALKNTIDGLLFGDDLFKGSLVETDEGRSIIFNCKRVGRLSHARAIGLLMSYTATLGRPAYEPGFGEISDCTS